jgi:hypothetical protein
MQFSPRFDIRESELDLSVGQAEGRKRNWEDVEFLRSWIVCDSKTQSGRTSGRNWAFVLGLGLSVVVSASCWTMLGLAILHFWK